MVLLERHDHLLAHAVVGANLEFAGRLVEDEDGAGVGRRQLDGLGDDRVEHRLQVEGGVHRLADLAERAQLLDRLGELAGAHLHLALEARIGFLQAVRHVVELVGEPLELVAGLDRDALAEVAAADALRAGPQHLDRDDHAAGEEEPGEKGQHQPAEHDEAGPLDRVVERGIGLLDRQLDEDEPAQRRHRRIGAQHLAAVKVLRLLHRTGLPRARRRDLGEPRHVGVAQHEADVRMRDQAAVAVDDIGDAALADLDLRDHVPDQLEIDLGDAHAGVAAGAGERQRHVRLGLAAEVDRAVIDLLRHRFGELGGLRIVGLRGAEIHDEPRDAQLLLAGGVELGELGDRRHLAQQPQAVETPLLDRARRPRQLRGPADLVFDLLDEVGDLFRRAFRLLALDADQRVGVLAVGEHDLEQAVAEQRNADDREKETDILAEQRPAELAPSGLSGRRRGAGHLRSPALTWPSPGRHSSPRLSRHLGIIRRSIEND